MAGGYRRILMREVAVSGLREFLAGVQVSVPVSNLAKWKTFLQIVALSFLIVGALCARLDTGNTDWQYRAMDRRHPDPRHRLGLLASER